MAQDGRNEAGTIDKIALIMRKLAATGPARISVLASELGIPKSTLHYHLDRLQANDLVVREGKQYRLSLRFVEMGEQVRNNVEIYDIAKPEVDTIASKLQELTVLMVEENGLGVYLYKASGEDAIDVDAPIGRHAYLHNRAMGKIILAHLPRDRLDEIIETHGLPDTTEETITDRSTLYEELEIIRENEVAYNNEESLPGMLGVAVPILHNGIQGALGLAGPVTRLEEEIESGTIVEVLEKSRNTIELQLQNFDEIESI